MWQKRRIWRGATNGLAITARDGLAVDLELSKVGTETRNQRTDGRIMPAKFTREGVRIDVKPGLQREFVIGMIGILMSFDMGKRRRATKVPNRHLNFTENIPIRAES
jgi:hypothetical protein